MSIPRTRAEKSSNVWSHGHDANAQELHVEYVRRDPETKELGPSGTVYVCHCTADEYAAACAADSLGSHIRQVFGKRAFRKREGG
jgi:hypothetical protein